MVYSQVVRPEDWQCYVNQHEQDSSLNDRILIQRLFSCFEIHIMLCIILSSTLQDWSHSLTAKTLSLVALIGLPAKTHHVF